MTTDLTFITNENGQSLKDRFNVLIKDARFLDIDQLVYQLYGLTEEEVKIVEGKS